MARPKFFLSRRWRPNKWPFFGLAVIELGLTVALLALFGIAAPNTYRTKLWQDGSDNGFNSSPTTGLYAAANYRPYTTPRVWSRFITNYNIVIAVLSMFLMLTKVIMYTLHVFPPILSVAVHGAIIALYSVSVAYQSSSDTTDPRKPQNGPPWYITKSCNVTLNKDLVGYCKQAKASFACTCAALGLFGIYFLLSVWSCFPSKAQREEYDDKKRSKAEKYAELEAQHEAAKKSGVLSYPVPDTPGFQGGLNPMTPRTLAFNTLGGTKDLPLRQQSLRKHFSTPNVQTSSPIYAIRSPDLPRSPMSPGFVQRAGMDDITEVDKDSELSPDTSNQPQLYFPPPPKTSTR